METEGSSSTSQPFLRRSYSFDKEEDFVGLEDDVDLVAKHLVGSHHRVVSICGMGGLGKTTLANKVYHHPVVKRHFHRFAWVCVSQQWQGMDILKTIMNKLVPEKKIVKNLTEEDIIRQVLKCQENMKCLIVLDDIWTEGAWESIKKAFPTEHNGTKILLTTRNRNVAEKIGPYGFHHEPRLLSNDESWNLLCRKLRRQICGEGHVLIKNQNRVEKLGKEMVAHCGGLPLAVIVLAGILSVKNSFNDWKIVLQNIKSLLLKGERLGEGIAEIPRILVLSYDDLPFQLKPCFLYLGSFPEDVEIPADTIYQMWIAEGMVLSEDLVGEVSMMQLAERYLKELGQRGLVQLQTLELPGIRGFRSCRLHDLMRDLCLLQAGEESFLKSITYSLDGKGKEEPYNESSTYKFRRLTISLDRDNLDRFIPPKREIAKHLRMFQFQFQFPFSDDFSDGGHITLFQIPQLNNFEMLRVLSIEGLREYGVKKLPKAIGKLIHLRYLSLKDSLFDALPSCLGNLKHMQTLDLRLGNESCRIPNMLWKMKELTCLYLPPTGKKMSGHILRLDGLNKLQILEYFDSCLCDTEDLIRLTNLRVLAVSEVTKWEDLEQIANYAQSSIMLQQVSINCKETPNSRDGREVNVLKQLFFGRNIHRLYINVSIWKEIPESFNNMSSSNLVELSLGYCSEDVEETICETLEKFPHLRILSLQQLPLKEMIFQAMGFPQLRELHLEGFEKLERWVVEEGAMPNLCRLWISNCPALKALPEGLKHITTLENLYIARMPQEFKDRIQILKGEDFYKLIDFFS